MKDELAERLLAEVMGWTPKEVASERPLVRAMADYKYDEYGQFSPGKRFVESLALWLAQFSKEERQTAYNFVKKRLIFCSTAEMEHLVVMTYPDFIRPILVSRTAQELAISDRYIRKISNSIEFKVLQRQCLFLGMSDGAHTDIFRRTNPELSHEQIWQAYEISPLKAKNMLKDLSEDLEKILGRQPTKEECRFRMVFLLDDFSASGRSCLRKNSEGNSYKGKIARFNDDVKSQIPELFFTQDKLYICVVLYMATKQAYSYLETIGQEFFSGKPVEWQLKVVQPLSDLVPLHEHEPEDSPFLALVDRDCYYDPSLKEDKHMQVGGGDGKRGFADCSLPLVLSHNTPNNSIFLLWADPQIHKTAKPDCHEIRGLFPRFSRHRSET